MDIDEKDKIAQHVELQHVELQHVELQHVELTVEDGENERSKNPSWRSIFHFTLRIHFIPLAVAVIMAALSGVIIPAVAIILGKIFNIFAQYGSNTITGPVLVEQISWYAVALTVVGVASGILNGGFFAFWISFGELQAKSAREKLFNEMLEREMEWYDLRRAGINTLISRLQTHVRALQSATSQPLGFVIQSTVTVIVSLSIAFYFAWNLTLVTLAVVPFASVFLSWLSARMQPSIHRQDGELNQASKLANNAISAIDAVKYFNGQDTEISQYTKVVGNAARFYLVQARSIAVQIGLVRFVTLGMFVQGFWFGSYLVLIGTKNAGQVLTAFWACLIATQAVEQIIPQMMVLERGRTAAATLKSILTQMDNGRTTRRPVGRIRPGYCDGDIEIRNVTFAYPSLPNRPILTDASFFFPAGETTYVVGKSGSGKSTLGYLLMRFYEPKSGDLLLDGNHIQLLDVNWLRSKITLIQQQSILFNDTIFNNIAFGRQSHGRLRKDDLRSSIQTAQLRDTIDSLPQGLDTVVGINGAGMSGGQSQRIDIARARLRDTPILILDEATSALDHKSKELVLEQIKRWRRGKTTIIITHDLSEIHDNNFVYVLEKGIVVQSGFRNILDKAEPGPFGRSLQAAAHKPFSNRHETHESFLLGGDENLPGPPENAPGFRGRSLIPFDIGPQPVWSQHRLSWSSITRPPAAAFPNESMTSRPLASSLVEQNDERLDDLHDGMPSERLPCASGSFERNRKVVRRISHDHSGDSRTDPGASKKKQKMAKRQPGQIASIQTILLTVWPNLTSRERVTLVCGFFFAGVHAAATPTFSYVFSKLLSTFYISEDRAQLALNWSLCVLAVALVDCVASYMMHYLLEYCAQAWVDALRVEAMRRVLDQPRSWFDKGLNSRTKLIECLDRNAEEMRNLVGRFAGYMFVAMMIMILAITWSLVLSWKITLVAVACAPALYALTRWFEAVNGKWENKSNQAGEVTGFVFAEAVSNIRIVKSLRLEPHFRGKYAAAIQRAFRVGLKKALLSGILFGVSDSAIVFVTALIFYYGAVLVCSGKNSVGNMITVLTMLLFSISTANAAIALIPQINSSRDTATRLLRLSNLPYRKSHEHTGQIRLSAPGLITFSSVYFTYPSRPMSQILSCVSLTIHPGITTALVGASGSGKSTITSLIMGLYPPASGDIEFDSVSIASLDMAALRAQIAIVPQTPVMFPLTVAQNIAYGLDEKSPLADMKSIREAATVAGIDEFISSLPEGYDTVIGMGGTGLSGGQAQRVAIARAIVRKPRLLILDEATSGLDAESVVVVRSMVREMSKNGDCGVLVVTHEREMMRMCEDIIVLGRGGAVVETGGFDDLLTKKGGELRRMLVG